MNILTLVLSRINASDFPFAYPRYSFFSALHLGVIFTTVAILILCFVLFARKAHLTERVLTVSASITVATIMLTAVYFLITGEYNIELYLPFHLCNLFFFLLPVAKVFPSSRKFLYDYMVNAGIAGCLLCAVFPLTSMAYYPVFHPVSLLVWTHHIVIGITGVFLLSSGAYKPYSARNLLTVLSAMLLAAVLVNGVTGANFLFLNSDYSDLTPLNYIYSTFPTLGIWAGVIILYITSICLQIYFCIIRTDKYRSPLIAI